MRFVPEGRKEATSYIIITWRAVCEPLDYRRTADRAGPFSACAYPAEAAQLRPHRPVCTCTAAARSAP